MSTHLDTSFVNEHFRSIDCFLKTFAFFKHNLACSDAPKSYARWSLRLLADNLVTLEINKPVSHMAIHRLLKKEIKPWLKKHWCLGKIDSRFICAMEQILDWYEKSYNSRVPVICVDERPCQLIGNIVVPIPMKPGSPKKIDYHYKRNGTCSVFVAVEPLTGFRHIQVKKQRTLQYSDFLFDLLYFWYIFHCSR